MHKRIFLSICVFLFSLCCLAQNAALISHLENLKKDPDLYNASWSVKAIKVQNGNTVISYNSQISLIPASLMKLVTTGVGYSTLSEDFRFTTLLMYDGKIASDSVLEGNLYIIGGGDPLLGSYRYKQTLPETVFLNWKTALKEVGIKTVKGNLCYDASIFDSEMIPNSWIWEDIGNYYGCGTSGLSFHENMYHVYFASDSVGEPAKIVKTEPLLDFLNLKNNVLASTKGSGDNVIIYGAPYQNTRYLTGTIPANEKEFDVRGSLPDPPLSCATLFKEYLHENGFSINGLITDASQQPETQKKARRVIMEYNSHSYSDIVKLTNNQSNNMYAECIFKYLGYMDSKKGSYASGSSAVLKFLKNNNISTQGITIADGSGLSRQNLLTSDFICNFLRLMGTSYSSKNFLNSLLRANRSVILSKTLDSAKQNGFYFKTGSMNNIRSYAGYINNSLGEQVCFSIIVNNFTCSQTEIRTKIEKLISQIAESK